MAKEEKVSDFEIEKLKKQVVKKDKLGDVVDAADRSLGELPSKIGQFFIENW